MYFQELNAGEARNQSAEVVQQLADIIQPLAGDSKVLMEKELEHFRMVVLTILVYMSSYSRFLVFRQSYSYILLNDSDRLKGYFEIKNSNQTVYGKE